MIAFTSHLQDDRLFDCYLAARSGEPLDPPAADHLADCTTCAARFQELSGFMETLRDDAEADLDALFPPDRLRQQQHDIARRIETVGRSARVIHFPVQAPLRQLPTAGTRALPRWVAATAAAGLFAGIAAGLFFDSGRRGRTPAAPLVELASGPRQTIPIVRPAPPIDNREDAFFSEIEVAADSPRTAELAAYDALTPHIREISLSISGR